jgi:hypothetical protein
MLYVYDVIRISSHAVSNVGVMDEWLIGTDLEESGRDPRELLWRRHFPDRTTKKFCLEVGEYTLCAKRNLVNKIRQIPIEFIYVTNGLRINVQ